MLNFKAFQFMLAKILTIAFHCQNFRYRMLSIETGLHFLPNDSSTLNFILNIIFRSEFQFFFPDAFTTTQLFFVKNVINLHNFNRPRLASIFMMKI